MRQLREILRLRLQAELSVRQIQRSLRVSVGAVSKILSRASGLGLSWKDVEALDDIQLANFFYPNADTRPSRQFEVPDWSDVHRELTRKGMTKQLLWEEYSQQYPNRSYSYPQYCYLYQAWQMKQRRSMRQLHRAGEKLFVDYVGQTVPVVCGSTGEVRFAQIFVAVLGASNYTFAEATWTQSQPDWLGSHVRAFEFFGGVPELVVPDNLKSGVTKACRYDPDVNAAYQQLAAHYGIAIVPARPYKPKDKAKAEVGVQIIERWILARLRHRKVRHRGRMARQRLGPAEADRELGDGEIVEEAEAFRLASLDEHREGRSRAQTMAVIDVLLARIADHAEIAKARHLGMALQPGANLGRVLSRALHPQFDRLEAAQ